ncbi:hypothetical protein [Streptomyces sp. NPDC015125]
MVDEAAFETAALRNAVDPIGELSESLHIYTVIQALPSGNTM